MRSLTLLCGVAAATLGAAQTPLVRFTSASQFVWGAGTQLPPPYSQPQDVLIIVRTWTRLGFFDVPLPTQTFSGSIVEAEYVKTSGSLNFTIDPAVINPIFPGTPFTAVGTVTGPSSARWDWDDTQAGPFTINQTIPNPPNPDVVINLTLRNVRNTGRLTANFSDEAFTYHPALGGYSDGRATHSGGDAQNFINVRPGSVTGTIAGVTISRIEIDVRTIQHVAHFPGRGVAVRCVVERQNFVGSVPGGSEFRWQLFDPGTSVLRSGGTVDSDPYGVYLVLPDLPAGIYDLAIQGETWLRQARMGVRLGPIVTTHAFTLANGDCDGNNVIDIDDFLLLAASYETSLGQPRYAPMADLNKDGAVDIDDFLILAAGYETSGWNP